MITQRLPRHKVTWAALGALVVAASLVVLLIAWPGTSRPRLSAQRVPSFRLPAAHLTTRPPSPASARGHGIAIATTRICQRDSCDDGYAVLAANHWYWAGYHYIEAPSLSPDGRYLITPGPNGDDVGHTTSQDIWDLTTGKRTATTVGQVFAWSADSRWAAGDGIGAHAGEFTRLHVTTGAVSAFNPLNLPAPQQGGYTFASTFPTVAGVDTDGHLVLLRDGNLPTANTGRHATTGPADMFIVDPASHNVLRHAELPDLITWTRAPVDPAYTVGSNAPDNAAKPLSLVQGWLVGQDLLIQISTSPTSAQAQDTTRLVACNATTAARITIPDRILHGHVIGQYTHSRRTMALVVASNHGTQELDDVAFTGNQRDALLRWHDTANRVSVPGDTRMTAFPD